MNCQHIDEYLDGDLDEPASAVFEKHLADCPSCANTLAQQRQINQLLTQATQRLDPIPIDLAARIDRQLRLVRRRRHFAFVATGAVAAVVAWALLFRSPTRDEPSRDAVAPSLELAIESSPSSPAMVVFPNESKLLIVPEETGSPNVTFVWVYPNQRKSSQ